MTLDLRVAGNNFSNGNRYWAVFPSATIVTRVDNAIASDRSIDFGSGGTLDLDGHNQSFNTIHGSAGSKVVSSRPAKLTVNYTAENEAYQQGYGSAGDTRVNNMAFLGLVSLHKTGAKNFTLGATSSSTGTLSVAAGSLTLAGSWPNCTNVVASGGTFVLKNANAFGDNDRAQGEKPKVVVNVTTGAALNLDYAGRIDCAEFHLDGVKLYGTFGATGSGANHEYEWITGTGILRALPVGTSIIFR